MNKVDITRHVDVFSRDAFGDKRIDVIGAGATGSRIILSLAKLGLENIHVWDFDTVEAHNIANQAYDQEHIGKLKVDAIADVVMKATGLKIHTHNEKVDGSQTLGDVIFLLTDTMSSRKEIWNKGIRYKMRTKLMIETRMGADEGRCYTVNPTKPALVKGWEGTLYDDAKAVVSACGTSITVGPTAEFMSGLAVWQFIRWQSIESGREDTLENEIIFGLRPMFTMSRNFE
jgi:molybdopterin/thiamine biosynthesis adenylyltransferase